MQLTTMRRAGAVWFGAAILATTAFAQGPAPSAQPAQPAQPARGTIITLDRIVAVVNDEVITQHEMDDQKRLVVSQLNGKILKAMAGD